MEAGIIKIKKIRNLNELEEGDLVILEGIRSINNKAIYLGRNPLMPYELRFIYKNIGRLFDESDFDEVSLFENYLEVKNGIIKNKKNKLFKLKITKKNKDKNGKSSIHTSKLRYRSFRRVNALDECCIS